MNTCTHIYTYSNRFPNKANDVLECLHWGQSNAAEGLVSEITPAGICPECRTTGTKFIVWNDLMFT